MTRERFEEHLVRVIHTSIKRKDTEHAVFHGCYDWHSAVHGHWALLRLDRVRQTHELAGRAAADRLGGQALDAEHTLLNEQPAFEMPYGRAWLLRLALELEQWTAVRKAEDARRMQPFADAVAKSLRSWLAERSFDPNTREYRNHSWAAAQLHAWYVHRKNEQGRVWVRKWLAAWKPDAKKLRAFADDANHKEFFSLYGNWVYAVLETQPKDAAQKLLEALPPPKGAIEPVVVPKDAVHALGMNWSRAWALKRLAAATTDDAERRRLEKAYEAHVAAGMKDHQRHVGRYLAYDHWVPQFAIYALTAGR